jgi:secreted trypsin-like serine protease
MSANRVIRDPLWATLVGALVAAMVVAFLVFVQSGQAAPQAAGEQPPRSSITPWILGGTAVPNGKYPFFAALLDKRLPGGPFQQQFCAGTLIDKDSVLTAAHCFFNPSTGEPDPQSIKVVQIIVGRTVLTSSQGQVRSVKRVFIHPDYSSEGAFGGGPLFMDYDAAVIELSRPVSGIAPIKLATSKQNYLEKPGRYATVAGWGSTTAQPACKSSDVTPLFANQMREAQVPIVSDSRADQLYQDICLSSGLRGKYTPPLMIAASGSGKDTCQADSGGPLFVARNGGSSDKYTQIGITSFGAGCGSKRYPAPYTEVNNPSIRSFIIKSAASR